MHILHGTWLLNQPRFALWGEDTTSEPLYRKGRRGRTAPHPFALSVEQWLRYLDRFTTDCDPDGLTITLLLPGAGKQVQPSPEAQAAGIAPLEDDLTLLAWEMDAVILNSTDFLDFMIQLPLPGERQTGFVLGSDLAFWQQAALLVMNCLIEQRYIPTLEQQGTRYLAHWQPLPDADLLAQLVDNMTPLCRAVADDARSAPAPRALLSDFLKVALDTFIREAYAIRQAAPRLKALKKHSVRHPWLQALTGPDRALTGSPQDNRRLFEAWQRWQEGIDGAGTGAFRVCFRLDEPDESGDRWPLHYLLQATDDPSLLVEARMVWSSTGSTLTYLERRFDHPQEKMLTALGLASRVFPPVERSLRQTSPTGVTLDRDEAYRFLIEAAPMLEQSHFGVLVPNWWAKRAARLKAKARLKGKTEEPSGFLTRDALIGYRWELSLGGERISRGEFEQLVALKQQLVRFRGEWVALDPDQIDAALKFFDAQTPDGEMDLLEALKLTAGAESMAAPEGLEIENTAIEGWLNDFFERLRHPDHAAAPAVPDSLRATLRPYQERGFGWLAQMRQMGLGACLADDMGLGKAQPLDAKILTPHGWKCMGKMQVGDEVINSQGGTSHITGVYPQGEKEIYRVVFRDGSSTECCDEHLWCVNTPVRNRRGNPPMVLPLNDIRSRLTDAVGNARFYVPMIRPVEFEEGELSLDPYLLGVLLGDGSLSQHSVGFSTADTETTEQVAQLVPNGIAIKKRGGYDYKVSAPHAGAFDPVLNGLRELGLMGCRSEKKFIPQSYLFASVQTRIALLQGLLDTDGSVSKDNVIEFATVSPQLAENVRELVESLGGIARLKSRTTHYTHNGERRTGQLSYRLIIALPPEIQPFRLTRKAERYHPRPKYPPSRAIVDVVYVGRKPAQCIAVDAPDHLYVTDHYILTHNTIQAITLWAHERERLGVDRPALVVCPTSVVGNWRHEISRFAPSLKVMTHQGPGRLQGDDFTQAAAQVDVVLTSYALLSRDRALLEQVPWSEVVLDEAQNIKNPATKQAQAARALPADMRLALTGTPVENRLTELWSIFQFLNPGYLGARDTFRHQFSIPIERYGDQQAAASLKQLTGPFILRRVKTDPTVINDLPEKFENKVYCSLTPEQATLYEATVREEMEAVEEAEDDMQRRGSVLRMLTRLKQICNHPAHFLKEGEALGVAALADRSGKLVRLTEMLEEVFASGDRALLFTQYAEMGGHLQAYLREYFVDEVLFLHGGTPANKRQDLIRQFQAPRGPTVFVLSLKAGGTGLNLTQANHVFHFDRWYNPAVENQATDRAFRIGQTRNVQVHKFICLGTLEERIDELIEHKQALADSIVGEGESWLSEMSTDDLRDLVALRRDVMED